MHHQIYALPLLSPDTKSPSHKKQSSSPERASAYWWNVPSGTQRFPVVDRVNA